MQNNIIGIDISKATFDVAFQLDGKWRHARFDNKQAGFDKLLGIAGENARFLMEASGPYHLPLAMYLYGKQAKVSVVNPLVIKRYGQMRLSRAKTGKKDARLIAEYGQGQQPPLWKPAGPALLEVQQIHTCVEGLRKQRTALSNQLGAFESSGTVSPHVRKVLKSTLAKLGREISKLEKEMQLLIKEHCPSVYKRLRDIPGIGPKTAAMLIVITHNFEKFSHHEQLIAFVGFSPRAYESGTSVKGKGRICKMGKSQIRKLLYMCTWKAKKCNPACEQMYERLKKKGKPERLIKIALANKLLKIAFAMGKNQDRVYDKNYVPKPCF